MVNQAMKRGQWDRTSAASQCDIRRFLSLPMLALLVVMSSLLHSGTALGQQTPFKNMEQKALDRITEARGHARQKRYSRALGDLRTAVALAKGAPQAKLTLALALHNMAEVYRLQNKSVAAVKAYREALLIYTELDHRPAIAITKRQIDAMHPDFAKKHPGKGDVTSATLDRKASRQMGRIDQAVERIRRRLGSQEASKAAKPIRPTPRTAMAPGSIQLAKSSPRQNRGSYAESVKRTINRGWEYPPSARSKHQEGSVEVELVILGNGELESVQILQSSGFMTLDMESIRSIREAAPFGTHALPRGQEHATLRLLFNYALPNPTPTELKARASRPPG